MHFPQPAAVAVLRLTSLQALAQAPGKIRFTKGALSGNVQPGESAVKQARAQR